MDNNTPTVRYSGIGFCGLLTILFIGLKLSNIIDWSWVWVLSPLWINFILISILCVLIVWIAIVADKAEERKRHNDIDEAIERINNNK